MGGEHLTSLQGEVPAGAAAEYRGVGTIEYSIKLVRSAEGFREAYDIPIPVKVQARSMLVPPEPQLFDSATMASPCWALAES